MTEDIKGADVVELIEKLQQAKIQESITGMNRENRQLKQANAELRKEKEEVQATLNSIQSASNVVRLKLSIALLNDESEGGSTWDQITSGARVFNEVIGDQQKQLEALVESLTVMRQRMTKAREVIRPYLPPDLQNLDTFDPAEEFQKVVDEIEEKNKEVDSLQSEKEKIRKDADYALQVAESRVREWEAHVIELAKAVGVPSNICGTPGCVNLDHIMNYVSQTMPAYKLLRRVDELEKDVEARFTSIEDRLNSVSFKPASKKLNVINTNYCPVCGYDNPKGVIFCACCSADLMAVCETCVRKGENCSRSADGTCDRYEGHQKSSKQSATIETIKVS